MGKVKKIAVVSLSRGILGESFVKHEVDLGIKRINDLGIELVFMPNALKGLEYIDKHPEDRAKDLLDAFKDDSIDMIFCAVGGEDTYRLCPYLFDNNELKNALKDKIFLGFSDTTFNHFMLRKVGLKTFYGQAFLPDTCELGPTMLPYTEKYFNELLETGSIKAITPSDVYYKSRDDFSVEAMGKFTESYKNEGFILVQGKPQFSGQIFGGCIDSIFDMFDNTRFEDTVEVSNKYGLFPSKDEWKGKILLLESSEEMATPEKYENMLLKLKERGIFEVVNGVIIGKPVDNVYFDEYNSLLKKVINNPNLPVVCNINIGHSTPRCIIPFGVNATVDVDRQIIEFDY